MCIAVHIINIMKIRIHQHSSHNLHKLHLHQHKKFKVLCPFLCIRGAAFLLQGCMEAAGEISGCAQGTAAGDLEEGSEFWQENAGFKEMTELLLPPWHQWGPALQCRALQIEKGHRFILISETWIAIASWARGFNLSKSAEKKEAGDK